MLKPSNQLGRGKSPVARKFSPRTHRKVENTAAIWISMKGSHLCGRNLFSEPIFGILKYLQVIRVFTKVSTKKKDKSQDINDPVVPLLFPMPLMDGKSCMGW